MTNPHPITVPLELVEEWGHDANLSGVPYNDEHWAYEQHIATRAAQWGADQQLEEDAEWLDANALFTNHLTITPSGDALRQVMRPNPSSLKEQALKALDDISIASFEQDAANTIRRALEQLDG